MAAALLFPHFPSFCPKRTCSLRSGPPSFLPPSLPPTPKCDWFGNKRGCCSAAATTAMSELWGETRRDDATSATQGNTGKECFDDTLQIRKDRIGKKGGREGRRDPFLFLSYAWNALLLQEEIGSKFRSLERELCAVFNGCCRRRRRSCHRLFT